MTSTSVVFDVIARDLASSNLGRIGSAATRSSGPLSNLGSKLKTFAKYAAVAAAAGGILAAKWGFDAVKAAAADQQAQKLLEGQLRRSTGATDEQVAAVEDWIDKTARAKGVADDELRPAFARLAAATGDTKKAQEELRLAMDVAASKGKTLKSVTEALEKAHNGSLGGLTRLGVKIKDNAGNTKTLEQITKELADTYGGAASEKANTFQGKMDRLKIAYDETKEAIGAKLLPVLSDLATWFLEDGIPAISKTWGWLKDKLGPVFGTVAGWVDKFRESGGRGEQVMAQLRDVMDALKAAFRDAEPFVRSMKTTFENMWLVVGPLLKKFAQNYLPQVAWNIRMLGKAAHIMGNAFIAVWNTVMQPFFSKLAGGLASILNSWGNMLDVMAHVPGFGWAKDAADKMHAAADQAGNIADNLKKIPPHTTARVDIVVNESRIRHVQEQIDRAASVPAGRTVGRTVYGGAPRGRAVSGGSDAGALAAAFAAALAGMTLVLDDNGTLRRGRLVQAVPSQGWT